MSACDRVARRRVAARTPAIAGMVATLVLANVASGIVRADDRIVAAAVGGGEVELFWLPEDRSWPAGGWRLERLRDGEAQLVAELDLGTDAAAMDRLDADSARGIADFADRLRRGTLTEEEREAADAVFAIAAIVDVDRGRALGLRYRDFDVPAGPVAYRLSALDARGDPFRTVDSEPVDIASPAPLPHAPDNVAVEIGEGAVIVSWSDPPEIDAAPIAGYRVIRVEPDGATNLTPELHLRTVQAEPAPLTLIDRETPRNRMFAYDVASVDLFGRSSTPKRILVTVDRLGRAIVPAGLSGEAGAGSATLAWSAVDNPGVGGLVIERSLFIAGPYEAITPDGVPAGTTRFEAADLTPGTAYFFRIRVYDRDGNLGPPSLPVKIVPFAAAAPLAPQNLTAEAGPTRVALTWDAPAEPVAGFFVFRRADGETAWKRLNGTVTPEPFLIDRFERGALSDHVLIYRVQAVGYDNTAGDFSAALQVALGDRTIPPTPAIVAASGAEGSARIEFRPGAPEAETNQFLVVRSDEETGPGLARGDPLAAEARRFDDPDVEAGATYWYEVIALDAAGNRSDPSGRVIVTVAAPPLPTPPAPAAAFRADPFPHVELEIAEIPDRALAVVEARGGGSDKWFVVAGPVGNAGPVNLTNLAGATEIAYRLVYQATDGTRGAPSPPTVVSLR